MAKTPRAPHIPVKYQPDGLTSDIDYLSPARGGFYDDALNIHFVTQGGYTTGSAENVLGNKLAYDRGSVTTQNVIFRVYFDVTQASPTARHLELFDGNGVSLGTATYTPTSHDLATTRNDFITAINGTGVTAIVGALVRTDSDFRTLNNSSTDYGYVSLIILDVPFWSYSVVLTGAVGEPLPIITQEAIDASLTGVNIAIGSYNVDGDLIIWSTSQKNNPTDIAIVGITNPSGSTVRIEVADTSLIPNGALVKLTGSPYDGEWIAVIFDATHFDLFSAVYTTNTPLGTVTININGIGEIGVAQKDANSFTWNYTRLLRSKELNFRTKNQIKAVCERNDNQLNMYWCDGNNPTSNPYRRLYYQGAYMTDGALNYVNPLGLYFYGDIYNATRLFQGNGLADILYSDQLQAGGSLYAGNYRYMVRFLDEFFNPTLWTDPSGIFVVSQNTLTPNNLSTAENVYGNASTDQTSKINQMLLSGIIPNLFTYYELGALFYVDGTTVPVFTIVKRELLDQTPTQIIQHTGNETNTQVGDINTLLAVQTDILTGLNIDIIANRLVPSNTSGHGAIDFSLWVDTFKYNLFMDTITPLGTRFNGDLLVEEYETSVNTFNKLGHIIFETYRYSCKFELLNGAFTENFHFSDITFDTSNTSPDGKRTAGLPLLDLTDTSITFVNIPALNVTGIDWSFQIGGIQMKDVVKRIHWERVEMTTQFQEVLGSGVFVGGVKCDTLAATAEGYLGTNTFSSFITNYGSGTNIRTSVYYGADFEGLKQLFATPPVYHASPEQDMTDYFFACGSDYSFRTLFKVTNQNIKYDDPNLATDMNILSTRDYGSFYGIDLLYNQSSYTRLSGDVLRVLGAPSRPVTGSAGTRSPLTGAEADRPNFTLFSGWTDTVANTFTDYTIDEALNVSRNDRGTFGGGEKYSKRPFQAITDEFVSSAAVADVYLYYQDLPASPVLKLGAPIAAVPAPFDDYAVYVSLLFRAKANKFGNKNLSKYIPSGAITEYLYITTNVYGDAFTQQNQIKHFRANDLVLSSDYGLSASGAAWTFGGQESGLMYYSQNRANSSMINKKESSDSCKANLLTYGEWLNVNGIKSNTSRSGSDYLLDYKDQNRNFIQVYNSGYNSQQNVTSDSAFDPLIPHSPRTPARFWWSLNKPENSLADLYTIILPLNFRDLDLTHSEIFHSKNVNGNLFTWQNRHYEMQYFDNTGLVSSSSTDVVFGSSGVASQRGSTLSTEGTKHGFSVIIGKSAGGKQTAYWINTESGKCMRYEPSDGTVCLSELQNMKWFFNNYFRFADIAFTPADGNGICGGWDDMHEEAVWSVRAKKNVADWDSTTLYGLYDEVFYQPTTYSTFEQTGEIYISLVAGNTAPPTDTTKWLLVPHFGRTKLVNGKFPYNYYNEFTLAYSEAKKKFTTRYSFLPKIYLDWLPTLVTPRSVEHENLDYEYYTEDSEYCTWYKDLSSVTSDIEQSEDGFISNMTTNQDSAIDKHFLALEMITEIVPVRMEFNTKKYKTFMVDTDFEARQDYFFGGIKNDSTVSIDNPTGSNEADTSSIFGAYMNSKLVFAKKVYQKLNTMVVKFKLDSRIYRT